MTAVPDVRPASSVLLLREAPELEVLMVERVGRGFFGGLMVFPGGGVDRCDREGIVDEVVVAGAGDRPWLAAGLRELAEETGIALTEDGFEQAPVARGASLYMALYDIGISLAASRLTFVSRWITPEGAPTRFDTRFYVAVVDGDPDIRIDSDELTSGLWVGPQRALELHTTGKWKMFTPTVAHLSWLASHTSAESAVDEASRAGQGVAIPQQIMEDGSIVPVGLPGGRK